MMMILRAAALSVLCCLMGFFTGWAFFATRKKRIGLIAVCVIAAMTAVLAISVCVASVGAAGWQ